MPGPPAFAVDQEVVVTGHSKLDGRQTHGHTGRVTRVVGEHMPRPLYTTALDGFAVEVHLTADELALVDDGDACRD